LRRLLRDFPSVAVCLITDNGFSNTPSSTLQARHRVFKSTPLSLGRTGNLPPAGMAYTLLHPEVWDGSANIAARHLPIHRTGLEARSPASSCLISSFVIVAMCKPRNSDCAQKSLRVQPLQSARRNTNESYGTLTSPGFTYLAAERNHNFFSG